MSVYHVEMDIDTDSGHGEALYRIAEALRNAGFGVSNAKLTATAVQEDECHTYSRAEIVDGTGWARDARFRQVAP